MKTEFKTCKSCNEIKIFDSFHKNPSMTSGRSNTCKKCSHERLRLARKDPKKQKQFAYYERKSGIKRRYGITLDQFEEMVKQQQNKCLICGNQPIPNGTHQSKTLHIDHCHKTKRIRGLLCHLCNRGIGLFRENKDLMIKAIEYLQNNS